MRPHVAKNFSWSQLWFPEQCLILAQQAVTVRAGTFEEDTQAATDAVITCQTTSGRCALRVRRPGTEVRYASELTITCRREGGGPCEWHKMINTAGVERFLYCIASGTHPSVGSLFIWWLIDMNIARPIIASLPRAEQGHNKDEPGKRCFFKAYRPLKDFPEAIVAYKTKDSGVIVPARQLALV